MNKNFWNANSFLEVSQKKNQLKKRLKILVIFLLMLPVCFFVVYSLVKYTSFENLLNIKSVEIFGLKNLKSHTVDEIEQQVGISLLDFEANEYEQKMLKKYPWIEKIKISKRYPSRLIVKIEEKKPIFMIYENSQWYGMLETGKMLPWSVDLVSLGRLPVVEKIKKLDAAEIQLFISFLMNLQQEQMIYSRISQIVIKSSAQINIWLNEYPIWFVVSLHAKPQRVTMLWKEMLKKEIDFFKNYRYLDLRVTNYGYLR